MRGRLIAALPLVLAACASNQKGNPVVYSSTAWRAEAASAETGDTQPAEKRDAEPPKAAVKGTGGADTASPGLPDATIAKLLVLRSLTGYQGSCVCPGDREPDGGRCGARSLYSKGGPGRPLCTTADVTPEMIADYRKAGS